MQRIESCGVRVNVHGVVCSVVCSMKLSKKKGPPKRALVGVVGSVARAWSAWVWTASRCKVEVPAKLGWTLEFKTYHHGKH